MDSLIHHGTPPELGHAGVVKPGRWLWLRSLLWLIGLTLLLSMAVGGFGAAMARLLPKDAFALRFAAQCTGAALAIGVYLLAVRFGERRKASELAPGAALVELSIGLLGGLLMFAAVMGILVGSGLYTMRINGLAPGWLAAGASIESGVVEELIVRGVILRLLWRSFGPIVAFVASALLFGAGHLFNPNASVFAALCIAIEAGVMLGAFYALTGRLWISIGVHAGWNFTQGYIFGAAVSGMSFGPSLASSRALSGHPSWLTGGAFGPEASLPGLLVCSAAGFATLYWAWKKGRLSRGGDAAPDIAPEAAGAPAAAEA